MNNRTRTMNSQSRSFGIPALYSMQSLQQVMTSGGVNVGSLPTVVTMVPGQPGLATMTTLSAMPQNTPLPQPIVTAPKPKPISPPTPPLYLCRTSNNATEPPSEEGEGGKEKASLELLQHDYDDLNTRKIKDSLSSFLPDIPGDFDSTGSTNTMLKHLLEQRMIGNREFLPLSGQALLGFRLLPGALPEQYRIDPPSLESKHHHKRKKRKRKQIEKASEEGGDLGPPAAKTEMPSDALAFIKHEQPHSHYPHPPSQHGHGFGGSAMMQTTGVIQQVGGHPFSSSIGGGGGVTGATTMGHGFMPGVSGHGFPSSDKKKKEKKKNKEKKKEKKEKKKKRDKHHGQDPSGPGAPPPGGGASGPTLQTHPSAPYSGFPHP